MSSPSRLFTIASLLGFVNACFIYFFLIVSAMKFFYRYDQQGSRWTLQAQQLNGRTGDFTIKPE